ncbi:Lysine-specific metallo-endopeptidase [Luteibacter sp. UNCMF331Sha3.1]|uniref:M35 family metallo-endopeptidase n=1 Tax=Luteibacter sp. UNCMF331Sha3.1 TaxID=1502760 RepID=UPI0008B6CD94|nr:M35 family metallo-endopeptidase [Luteibacter sp. UNCMF331Sha3.1]SEM26889.1 Lysine-specific metallo-endopeptidase [Luteibacter sp. UNCMF331Sha3.1]
MHAYRFRWSVAAIAYPLMAGALAFSSCALAEERLRVTLSTPGLSDPLKSSIVHVEMVNEGDRDVAIYEWDTPFVQSAGRLAKRLFQVKDAFGNEVRYRGRWVNTGRILANQFIVMHPGDRREADVDLRVEYDYGLGGAFSVKYVLPLDREPDRDVVTREQYEAFRHNEQKNTRSNVTTIYIDGPVQPVASVTDDDCSEPQKGVIRAAKSRAFDALWKTDSYMSARYERRDDGAGGSQFVFVPHPRYERWLGAHSGSEPSLHEEGFSASDNGLAYERPWEVFARLVGGAAKKLQPRCGCPGYPPTTPAWAEVETTYVVHFCDPFFELPEMGLPSSRMGTVIHELSHFDDGMKGTEDYVYGRSAAEKLAKENRSLAVRNADNFEFFIVDTTPYDEKASLQAATVDTTRTGRP